MKPTTALFIAIIICMTACSQDLTGTWIGSGAGVNYARLCIIRVNGGYIGYTYDEGMGHCTCNYRGSFDSSRQKLKGMNDGIIEKTFLHSQSRYNLSYYVLGEKEQLRGSVSAKSVGAKIMSFGLPMPISYIKISNEVDTTEYMRGWIAKNEIIPPLADSADVMATIPPAVEDSITLASPSAQVPDAIADSTRKDMAAASIINEKNKRITDTVSVITIHEKELLVKVLDNGIVDGDTVSILHNGKLIAERISVTGKPYEFKITIAQPDELQEIVLVAHNLGSIPPNTALILVQTPSQEYRLTASTDLRKNAMILFRYRE